MRMGKVHVEGRFVDPRLKAVVAFDPAKATGLVDDRPQVFEPPRVLVWELVMGCIWIAV